VVLLPKPCTNMLRPFSISTGAWKYTERESRAQCELDQ
jgi:hypothetical protein